VAGFANRARFICEVGRLKTALRIVAFAAVLVCVLYALAIEVVIPRISKSQIEHAIEEGCASCRIEVGSVSFEFFSPSRIRIRDVRLKQGYEGSSELLIRLDSVFVDIDLARSTRDRVFLSAIEIARPDVFLVDGDASSPKSNDEATHRGIEFSVEKTTLTDGSFTYRRDTKGTSATLHLAKIQGELSPFGSLPELKEQFVEAHLRAQIEGSGETEIDLRVPMQGGQDNVDLSLYLRDQDLAVTTAFFNPNAGVELKGTIVKARGRVRVRDQELTASAWVIYHGLELKLNAMYDRSRTKAFFLNLGADLAMKEEDLDLDKKDQTEDLHAKREPGERIVGFVLRGLKEAAIKVAMKAPVTNQRIGLTPANQ
jgi:hypothetical protein